MTVTADDRRRVTLPEGVSSGDRFDVRRDGVRIVLVPLVPATLSESELRRRIKALKWSSRLTPEESRALVTEGRA